MLTQDDIKLLSKYFPTKDYLKKNFATKDYLDKNFATKKDLDQKLEALRTAINADIGDLLDDALLPLIDNHDKRIKKLEVATRLSSPAHQTS